MLRTLLIPALAACLVLGAATAAAAADQEEGQRGAGGLLPEHRHQPLRLLGRDDRPLADQVHSRAPPSPLVMRDAHWQRLLLEYERPHEDTKNTKDARRSFETGR